MTQNTLNNEIERILREFDERFSNYLPDNNEITDDEWVGRLIEHKVFLNQSLRSIAEKTVEAVRVEGLNEFLEHSTDCILSWYEAGRPTKDGYEQKYRGVWYQSRPIDNTPKCDCGLAELLTEQTNLANH